MRIIAGSLRGRRLNPPTSLPVRPTTDMARESLFNILNNYVDFEEVTVMDLFAGTGAVSIDFIKQSASHMGINNLHAVRADVFDLLKRAYKKFDIIFADPPYGLENLSQIPDAVFSSNVLTDDGIFILEHPREFEFEQHPHFWQHRHYGKVNFTFFAQQLDQEQ